MMIVPCQQAEQNKMKKTATRMKKFYLAKKWEPKKKQRTADDGHR